MILQKIGTPDDEVIDRIPSEKVSVLVIWDNIFTVGTLVTCISQTTSEIF